MKNQSIQPTNLQKAWPWPFGLWFTIRKEIVINQTKTSFDKS